VQTAAEKCFLFLQSIINNIWNKLPACVVDASSVSLFKKRLDEWNTDVEIFKLGLVLTSTTILTSGTYELSLHVDSDIVFFYFVYNDCDHSSSLTDNMSTALKSC